MVHLYIQEKDLRITDLQDELRYASKFWTVWLRKMSVVHWKPSEFSDMKMEKRELEANLTSIRLELSENEHLKLDAEIKRDDLAKVGFQNDIFIWKPSSEIH